MTFNFFSDKSMAEDSEIENDQNFDSEEDEVEVDEQIDVVPNELFLLENEDLEKHKVEIIAGDKKGSEWLVIDDIYILHKYRTS